jgi:hypothetical protein
MPVFVFHNNSKRVALNNNSKINWKSILVRWIQKKPQVFYFFKFFKIKGTYRRNSKNVEMAIISNFSKINSFYITLHRRLNPNF